MTAYQAKAVVDFMIGGGMVTISGAYVDGFAQLSEDASGRWMLQSDVWSAKPLVEWEYERLAFYERTFLEVAAKERTNV